MQTLSPAPSGPAFLNAPTNMPRVGPLFTQAHRDQPIIDEQRWEGAEADDEVAASTTSHTADCLVILNLKVSCKASYRLHTIGHKLQNIYIWAIATDTFL